MVPPCITMEGSCALRKKAFQRRPCSIWSPNLPLGTELSLADNALVLLKSHQVSLKENVCGSLPQISRRRGGVIRRAADEAGSDRITGKIQGCQVKGDT